MTEERTKVHDFSGLKLLCRKKQQADNRGQSMLIDANYMKSEKAVDLMFMNG